MNKTGKTKCSSWFELIDKNSGKKIKHCEEVIPIRDIEPLLQEFADNVRREVYSELSGKKKVSFKPGHTRRRFTRRKGEAEAMFPRKPYPHSDKEEQEEDIDLRSDDEEESGGMIMSDKVAPYFQLPYITVGKKKIGGKARSKSPWLSFLKEFRKEHPELRHDQRTLLQLASQAYHAMR